MKTYVRFDPIPASVNRKTQIWAVRSKSDGTPLGQVAWHSPWRRYVFEPAPDTLFDYSCLLAIAEFCNTQTLAQKTTWKGYSGG